MLSPMIPAAAAVAITNSISRCPCEARTAAVISAVSPGTGTPLDSTPTSRASSGYPMLPGTFVGLQAVAEIELGLGLALRLLEGTGVHAVERLAVAVVGALDGGAALGQRKAGHLH